MKKQYAVTYLCFLISLVIVFIAGGGGINAAQSTQPSVSPESVAATSYPEVRILDPSELSESADPEAQSKALYTPPKAPEGMQKTVYLTFDDGPSPVTPQILDILAEKNVKATFFVIKHTSPNVVPMYKRITDAGHTIALHSATHAYRSIYASPEAFWSDFVDIMSWIEENTGVSTTLFRFPGGASNTLWKKGVRDQIIAQAAEKNAVWFDWNVTSGDATSHVPSAENMRRNVVRDIDQLNDPRAIVLYHDGTNKMSTINSLAGTIDDVKERGYAFDTCDHLTESPVHHGLK